MIPDLTTSDIKTEVYKITPTQVAKYPTDIIFPTSGEYLVNLEEPAWIASG